VAEVNPAARRKLAIRPGEDELPVWLRTAVEARIQLARETGVGLGETPGEQTFVGLTDGRSDFRVGIAHVPAEGGRERRWLLTVEKGGPSLWERVEQAEDALGLTPRESLVLELLARGNSNRQIAELAAIKETTVKFHLLSVMRKSGTANRTELLAAFYAGDLSAELEEVMEPDEVAEKSVDLGFVRITWDESNLVRVVMAEGLDLTLQCAQLLWNEFEARFDAPVRLYADIVGLSSVAPEISRFFAGRAGQRVRGAAVRASGLGRAVTNAYLTERRPPYPMRLFRTEEEAMSWLRSLD